MDYISLFTTQLTDLFRIGLLMGLVYTIERTRSQTGLLVPVLAGLAFVAVMIPSTMPVAGVTLWSAIATGLAANIVIFAVLWLIWSTVKSKLPK